MVSQSFQEPSDESSNEIDLFSNLDLPKEPLRGQKFKQDTGLYINWLDKLTDEEKWQAYTFFTRTSSGKKLAKNALEKYKERISVNQGLGRELSEARENLLKLENSEILAAGKWLWSALSKRGHERQQHLLERDLVHRDDYNGSVTGLQRAIHDIEEEIEKLTNTSGEKVKKLGKRVNTLRSILKAQQKTLEDIIRERYGDDDWNFIQSQLRK
ncbi:MULTISPECIES: hypothetical protein [unclassified Synechocystis]|uniref:hypothetical protein n=1 Tax=unclassified Synechocystis TaxID=2640012 RepID=UPI00041688DB|nr:MULTISPECIES: hypothetical protein [unclassified Synechocystis]AIE74189.1 hypothetical protein D082_16610 [Synechocystis sp. PCC 6714]MCT0252821.1 hypothetical protein [Synechocystis sp. CS-94]